MKRVMPNRLGTSLLFVGYALNVFIICLLLGSATQHENHKESKQSLERESVDLRSRKIAIVGADGNPLITFGSNSEANTVGR